MSSVLRRSTRARTGQQRAARHNGSGECALLDLLMGVADYREVLCKQLDYALLYKFRVSRAMRSWIDPLLAGRGVEDADVRAGFRDPLLAGRDVEDADVRAGFR